MLLMGGTILNAEIKQDSSSLLPNFDGWTKKGATAVYNADNLYEYIDGAADVFLSYDFQELLSQTYENDKKASFSIDIYKHSSEKNGYGIYSQEKPVKDANFLSIGAQGYYEKGVLNFLKGSYYVKLSGYDLGDDDKKILVSVAQTIADRLEGSKEFPVALKCFPEKGRITESEKYIAQNFLGHAFLHSAFITEYDLDGQKSQVFIIETDSKGSSEILQKYQDFIKKKGGNITISEDGTQFRIEDPYYKANGTLTLEARGNYIWGLFSREETLAKSMIDQIREKLKETKLI